MGQAILHIHTTYSDGAATVREILDRVERDGRIDVVGFTDHDDVRAYHEAVRWKIDHPRSRVHPLWGVELTCFPFKHLLLYRFARPFPEHPPRRFQPVTRVIREAHASGATVVVPHPATFWVGLGIRRVQRLLANTGLDGIEVLNPYARPSRTVSRLVELTQPPAGARGYAPAALGGSDAHHLQDLYNVIIDFPGHTVADLGTAIAQRGTTPRWGPIPARLPLHHQLRQHHRALVTLPLEQLVRSLRHL
ncbi:MAG: PHP domain-containing protein [Chloroflexota bacterium]